MENPGQGAEVDNSGKPPVEPAMPSNGNIVLDSKAQGPLGSCVISSLSAGCVICMTAMDKEKLLSIDFRVEGLHRLHCDDSEWASAMLRKFSPGLKKLQLFNPSRCHLELVQQCPLLLELEVRGWNEELDDAPFTFSPHPGQKLRFLSVELPREATRSLCAAHRKTLRIVRLYVEPPCDGQDEWPISCNDLPDLLAQCNLRCLKKLFLLHQNNGHRNLHCKELKEQLMKQYPNSLVWCHRTS